MLRTRLWMGALLVLFAVGLLAVDDYFAPWYPCLLVVGLVASLWCCHELIHLLPRDQTRAWVSYLGVLLVVLANWPAHLGAPGSPWAWVSGALALTFLGMFLVEAHYFREPGGTVPRLSMTLFIVTYVALLASFLLQIRWLPQGLGAYGLALAIFIPKCGDIGAYSFGRLFGRHRMSPVLSPKKSWEGAVGSCFTATAAALGINALWGWLRGAPPLPFAIVAAMGIVVGIVGLLGDLMESLVKRDCERKDASTVVPGFGGGLDVLDSVLFSAPVSYWWLVATLPSTPQ